jgi:pyruvate dehydrogenase E1 component alpha subunit
VITGYRDHGHMLAYGIDPNIIMAELTGRAAGISRGKGGSMHMFSTEHKFYGGHGIVGAQVSLGAGLAFAHKYNNDGGVCLAYFGDGAANQGQVYESFNMAELWKLPIIFVIENNQYAMGTSVNRASAEDQLYRRGESFRIPGLQVDGMDVLAVRGAAEVALDWVRSGKGPILLEMKTYRYRGHSMSDPAKYRSREEVQSVREKVGSDRWLQGRSAHNGCRGRDLKAIEKEIRAIVNASAEFAEQAPEPDLSELYTDVLVETY